MILHEELATIERAQQVAAAWLRGIGLELKPSKTRITHTLVPHGGNLGFDFLGCRVRRFRVGKTHPGKTRTGKDTFSKPLGFKTLIKPSPDAQQRHLAEIAELVRRHRQSPQEVLVEHLKRRIGGWANYHSAQVSKEVFSRMDHLVYCKLRRWAYRRHPNKSRAWVHDRYWRSVVTTAADGAVRVNNWVFAAPFGEPLALHARTVIQRHVKVEGDRSFFDGDWAYWASRLGRHPELPHRVAVLLKQQKGRCALCGLFFKADDLPEVDHIVPRSQGGKDDYSNWQLVHRHCHDQKTATDGLGAGRGRGGTRDKGQDKAAQRNNRSLTRRATRGHTRRPGSPARAGTASQAATPGREALPGATPSDARRAAAERSLDRAKGAHPPKETSPWCPPPGDGAGR